MQRAVLGSPHRAHVLSADTNTRGGKNRKTLGMKSVCSSFPSYLGEYPCIVPRDNASFGLFVSELYSAPFVARVAERCAARNTPPVPGGIHFACEADGGEVTCSPRVTSWVVGEAPSQSADIANCIEQELQVLVSSSAGKSG